MPESSDALHVFLGEYFWGRAHDSELPHYVDFVYAERHGVGRPPRKLLVTCEGYFWEPGEDCSIEKTISIRLPSKWLADRMQLRRLGPEGELCDPYGNLVAFDPSVTVPGPGTLLISRDAFLEFLDENGYAVFWTLLGEKLVIGGSPVQPARLGRLGISGCYCMEDGEIRGGLHTHLVR